MDFSEVTRQSRQAVTEILEGANVKEGTYTNPTIPFVADYYYEYDEDQMQENHLC